jgi:phosphoserine aminotransferase
LTGFFGAHDIRNQMVATPIRRPIMSPVHTYIDALKWAEGIGRLTALHARVDANIHVLTEWAARTPWMDFLVSVTAIRSNTSVCRRLSRRTRDPDFPRSADQWDEIRV